MGLSSGGSDKARDGFGRERRRPSLVVRGARIPHCRRSSECRSLEKQTPEPFGTGAALSLRRAANPAPQRPAPQRDRT
ncbi:hypothetical protein HMPREF9440_01441 [Sutterella parvirubra YIT 11816]|uniref:Uncharacterized protein n=1 Tax=Sutterella parvirubra YIT 11816 TaxID=762967 RepID=H3KFC3_9BURK|nr:hypothetical protein HMPREF9440_01441 [Sutterella parvirubra YIT 11816]